MGRARPGQRSREGESPGAEWEQAWEGRRGDGGEVGRLYAGRMGGYKSPTQPSRAARLVGRLSALGARPR